LEIGGPVESSWREQVLTRVAEQRKMLEWLMAERDPQDEQARALEAAVVEHLTAAKDAAAKKRRMVRRVRYGISGATIERTSGHLDAVECDLLRLASESFRRGQLPSLLAHVRRHLEAEDPRRLAVEQLATRTCDEPWEDCERERVLAAVHAASSKARREVRQIRSFRNTLYAAALSLTVAAIALAIVGWRYPSAIPLCFTPLAEPGVPAETVVVCPTREAPVIPQAAGTTSAPDTADQVVRKTPNPGDVALIELLGLMAAALAAAVALRNIKGTTSPYSLPIALAILKLPTGALTAVIAIVLMRGEFIPGLSALDSSAQILAWAVVFGYAQQLFTQLIDRQGQTVLNNVRSGGTSPPGPQPASTSPAAPANV
jgi:hypothetical protein